MQVLWHQLRHCLLCEIEGYERLKALAVFHDHGGHILDRWLRPGFRHVFCALASGDYWIRIDGQGGSPMIEVVAPADYDLAMFYREEGFTVIETQQGDGGPLWPLAVANCVGLVKTVLVINAPLAVTPWRLYRHMTRGALLPGKSLFSPPRPRVPTLPPAPSPPPERTDPAIAAAAKSQREADLRRRGRRSLFTGSAAGVTDEATLGRPAATLGG